MTTGRIPAVPEQCNSLLHHRVISPRVQLLQIFLPTARKRSLNIVQSIHYGHLLVFL